tara:strand:- start:10276 stop:11109 length:834 start_codon:yes stop_codon:yes gene_type:complete
VIFKVFHVVILFTAVFVAGLEVTAAADTEVTLQGQAVQGGLLRGRAAPGTRLRLGRQVVRVSEQGNFILGFGRDAPQTVSLAVVLPTGKAYKKTISVKQRHYQIQHIDGLPSKMVTPPAERRERIRREAAKVRALRTADTDLLGVNQVFVWPAQGRVSGVYGSQRILNGVPKRPHFGLDIAAPIGTPVIAPAAGKVVLVADLYYTGHTVLIDHGHGLNSVYCHLSKVDVKQGQMVEQGQLLGGIGATGRATGPHLHWGVNWFGVRLDPQLFLSEAQS